LFPLGTAHEAPCRGQVVVRSSDVIGCIAGLEWWCV